MALLAMQTGGFYSSGSLVGLVDLASVPSVLQPLSTELPSLAPPSPISTDGKYHSNRRRNHQHQQKKTLLSVSQKVLHSRRGLSQGQGLENFHPTIPQEFTDAVHDAMSEYGGMESDCSSPVTAQFLETSQNNWAGNTTDRSSSYSTVTYDDFDKEASLHVQRLFNDIDSMLFEPTTPGSSQLFEECTDWSLTFPHLRVLGDQVCESSEKGYEMVESRLSRSQSYMSDEDAIDLSCSSYSDSCKYGDSSCSSLTVEGTHVRLQNYSASLDSNSTHMNEEVLAVDGYYEDIIAIDSDLHEDPLDSKTIAAATQRRQKRSRYPPVTPNACARDDIVHSVFDGLWHLLTHAMRIILQRYSEHFVLTHPMAIVAPQESDHEDEHLKLPQILMPGARMDAMSLPLGHAGHKLRLSASVLSRPSQYTIPGHNSNDQLRKILHISKMGMTDRREKTFLEDGTETPVAGLIIGQLSNKKFSGARNMSANRRGIGRGKLMPLNDRARTPNVDDEILRGQGIAAVGKRLSSPPMMGSRTLPPINHSDMGSSTQPGHTEEPSSLQPRGIHKRGNRASSAIAEKETRLNLKEKSAIIAETRPSTTHTTYPTEQSGVLNMGLQRSSTPMDRTAKLRNDVPLGITGSSFGQQSALGEVVEGRCESVNQHSQWAPPHTASVPFRRNRTMSSYVK